MTQTTNAATARAATDPEALSLHGTRLIGTMTSGPRASALLRERDGTIRKVAVWDRTDAGRVERIAEDHVILRRRDRLYQLALAG